MKKPTLLPVWQPILLPILLIAVSSLHTPVAQAAAEAPYIPEREELPESVRARTRSYKQSQSDKEIASKKTSNGFTKSTHEISFRTNYFDENDELCHQRENTYSVLHYTSPDGATEYRELYKSGKYANLRSAYWRYDKQNDGSWQKDKNLHWVNEDERGNAIIINGQI